MATISSFIVILVAVLHIGFLVLEMFLWDKPLGQKIFKQTPEQSALTKVLAANQGLYNGFIAAGLLVGVMQGAAGYSFKIYFLACVIVAGIYGAITVSRRILFVQALPGAIGLVLVLLAYR